MANFVLDISRIPDGSAAAVANLFCAVGSDQNHIDLTPSANGVFVLGVVMDALDAAKVVEGGAVAVRVMGIAPVRLGTGGAAPGDRVVSAPDGKAILGTTAANFVAGIALQTGSAGTIIDVLLTPGAKWVS
jgi:hypothetical protein